MHAFNPTDECVSPTLVHSWISGCKCTKTAESLARPQSNLRINYIAIIFFMNYRRVYVAGGTYFFTLVTHQRKPIFSDLEAIDTLRAAFKYAITRHPFTIVANVILPDHIHSVWTLPPNDSNFSTRWRLIKGYFTRNWTNPDIKVPVWQRRFWEHLIRDETDLSNHVEYIHYNPVKHGLANSPYDWPYSSFSRFVKEGWYPTEWGKVELIWDGVKLME